MIENLPMITGQKLARLGAALFLLAVPASSRADTASSQADTGANQAPRVSLHITGNTSFFWPRAGQRYIAIASDAEDGDTLAGTIAPGHVAVTFEYEASGTPTAEPGAIDPEAMSVLTRGRDKLADDDCVMCHTPATDTVIPSYTSIAEFYSGESGAANRLARIIREGGQGTWGDILMPPHPDLVTAEAEAMARYVLSFATPGVVKDWLPITGRLAIKAAAGQAIKTAAGQDGAFGSYVKGRYVLTAVYTDTGGATGYARLSLRGARIAASDHDHAKGMSLGQWPDGTPVMMAAGASGYLGLGNVDLSDVDSLTLMYAASGARGSIGTIEVRLGAPQGQLGGTAELLAGSSGDEVKSVNIPLQPSLGSGRELFIVYQRAEGVNAALVLGTLIFNRAGGP